MYYKHGVFWTRISVLFWQKLKLLQKNFHDLLTKVDIEIKSVWSPHIGQIVFLVYFCWHLKTVFCSGWTKYLSYISHCHYSCCWSPLPPLLLITGCPRAPPEWSDDTEVYRAGACEAAVVNNNTSHPDPVTYYILYYDILFYIHTRSHTI